MPRVAPFTEHYAPSLNGTYDVVDRLVLRRYFPLGSACGDLR